MPVASGEHADFVGILVQRNSSRPYITVNERTTLGLQITVTKRPIYALINTALILAITL
jgi:hypothetical protein